MQLYIISYCNVIFKKFFHLLKNTENHKSVNFLACREGWYGDNCSQQCVGHCRDNSTCNHVTGQCDKGCAAGWTGIFCNKGSINKN